VVVFVATKLLSEQHKVKNLNSISICSNFKSITNYLNQIKTYHSFL